MPCENCPEILNEDVCIQVFPNFPTLVPAFDYGVEFIDIVPNIVTNTTIVRYRVCNCNPEPTQTSGISHIDFEICPPDGPGPGINVEASVAANLGILDPGSEEPVEFTDEFGFESIKINLDSVEEQECIFISLVYNGIFTEEDLVEGNVGVKIGGGRFAVPTTANFAFGLPLLLNCEDNDECPNTCVELCEDSSPNEVEVSCTITSPDSQCITGIGDTAELLNYCVTLVGHAETGSCQSTAFIPTCNGQIIECCLEVPYIYFPEVNVEAVFQVNAMFDGCEGTTPIPLTCVVTATFTDQYCFYCPNTDVEAILDALDECLLVEIGDATVVNGEVNATVTFTCPEIPEAPPEPPTGFVRRLFK